MVFLAVAVVVLAMGVVVVEVVIEIVVVIVRSRGLYFRCTAASSCRINKSNSSKNKSVLVVKRDRFNSRVNSFTKEKNN